MSKVMKLTDVEQKLIELYRSCDKVDVYLHGRNKLEEAQKFVNILSDDIQIDNNDGTYWVCATLDKIHATGFYNCEYNKQNE